MENVALFQKQAYSLSNSGYTCEKWKYICEKVIDFRQLIECVGLNGRQGLFLDMGEADMGKGADSVSIIGGADGPTSIFIARKGGKVKFITRIQNFFRKIKRNRIKRRITANPHTLEEVMELLKREYGAVEVSNQSHNYLEQRRCLKASLVMRYRPDLIGELMDLKPPRGEDAEALKVFLGQIQERNNRAAEIADDIFPLDFHIYEIVRPENGKMQVEVETVWQVLGGSVSGDRKTMKQLKEVLKKIYLYYGVNEEDIKNETERYKSLLTILCP